MSRPTTRMPPRQVKRTWAFADFADRGVPRVQAIDECLVVCWFLDAGNQEAPHAQLTGVQKAPRHEVAGKQRAL
jgi:hypothetical protein